MLKPRRFLLAALVTLAATALAPLNAQACTCIDRFVEQQVAETDVIFRGRLISSKPFINPPTTLNEAASAEFGQFDVHTFDVLDVVKGELGAPTQVLERTAPLMTCSTLGIHPGQVLLVFATRMASGQLETGVCSGIQADASGAQTRWLAEHIRRGAQP